MIWYYLKQSIRNLAKNKSFSSINIVGFAAGISICLAIVLFLQKEFSYDKHIPNHEQIVRLIDTKNNSSSIDYRVKDILQDNYSEIENACLVQLRGYPLEVKTEHEGFYIDKVMSTDNEFFKMFSVEFVAGNSKTPFVDQSSVIITESIAKVLFGTKDPIGQKLELPKYPTVTVTAVVKDFPETASIAADLIVNAENKEFKFAFSCANFNDKSTHRWPFRIYLQLAGVSNKDQFFEKVNSNASLLAPFEDEIGYLNLSDIYLRDTTQGSHNKKGNLSLLKLLASIALIILTLAIINYVNLTIAQQSKRNKATGVKKTIGAHRKNLLNEYLTESTLVTFVSFILAIFLVWITSPIYSTIFQTSISVTTLFKFSNPYLLISAIVVIGLLSGVGPAFILSKYKPISIIRGNMIENKTKGYLRNALIIFQFATSIILIFCVTTINKQVEFVKHMDHGFNKEHLLRLDVPRINRADERKALLLLDELDKSPHIKSFSISKGVPGRVRMTMGSNIKDSDKNLSVPCIIADTAFIKTMGIEIIKGRDLEPGDYGKVCMVNESYYKHFNFENLENKKFNNYGGYDIIAVVKDFNYSSLHDLIGPSCIIFNRMMPSSINIRFENGQTTAGMKFIKDAWNEILPGYPVSYQFFDQWFDSMYKKEERFAKTIGLFAVLAIIISCIGILGLAIFSSEKRIKEIGVRKVNGAKVAEILTMLNKDFVKWVVIAFILACPIAYYAMDKWLENFAYKTELSWWIFALAGILALGIALLTVSWQSWKAATRNPVEALRYE
ncbi:ABC transporter permease [Puteibacter caeruleilacunae]|nr:ABC transporter permease [Puteibacter caeruleilacunae]